MSKVPRSSNWLRIATSLAVIFVYSCLAVLVRPVTGLGVCLMVVAAGSLICAISLVRKDQIGHLRSIALAGIFGGFFGIGCLSLAVLHLFYGYDHGFGEDTEWSSLIGGILGALCFAWIA